MPRTKDTSLQSQHISRGESKLIITVDTEAEEEKSRDGLFVKWTRGLVTAIFTLARRLVSSRRTRPYPGRPRPAS